MSYSAIKPSDLIVNPLSANRTKWSNPLKQFVGNCLSVFDHFVKLALKGLKKLQKDPPGLMT